MSASRPSIAFDRAYDLRVLTAIPPTLGLFTAGTLEAQLQQMTTERRAICFTIMVPTTTASAGIATVLVCLHVAPELAGRGVQSLLDIIGRTVEAEPKAIHEMAAGPHAAAFYREAVYLETDASVSVTTHSPVCLPSETMTAVAAVTKGAPVEIVTTIAIAPWRPELVARLQAGSAASPTLH